MNDMVEVLKERISYIEMEVSKLFRDYEDGVIGDYEYGQRLYQLAIRQAELRAVVKIVENDISIKE